MEHMLKEHPNWQGRAVLIQIANPPRGKGINLEKVQPISERMAYYSIAECVVVTAVRDGMNLTPYEYIVCREGVSGAEPGSELSGPKKSMPVVSEFIGCSPFLSGAIRVNPWNIESTAEAMNEAISLAEPEKELRHEKHYRYVRTHDVAFWVVALDPRFKKLYVDDIVSAYCKAKNRAILLDYDGTLMPQNSIIKTPSAQVLSLLNRLSSDPQKSSFHGEWKRKGQLKQVVSFLQEAGTCCRAWLLFVRYVICRPYQDLANLICR
ncbi:hypothetical protein ACS0TY_026553 [Phlomoides rotata]